MLTTYIIFAILGLGALGTLTLAVFMLMDARAAQDKDDIASRITKAVDKTANANGLWTRRMRIAAIAFLVCLLSGIVAAVYILQNFRESTWNI